jgi:hypothetical protein
VVCLSVSMFLREDGSREGLCVEFLHTFHFMLWRCELDNGFAILGSRLCWLFCRA